MAFTLKILARDDLGEGWIVRTYNDGSCAIEGAGVVRFDLDAVQTASLQMALTKARATIQGSTRAEQHPVEAVRGNTTHETRGHSRERWSYQVPSLSLAGGGYSSEGAAIDAGRRAVGRQLALLRGDKQ